MSAAPVVANLSATQRSGTKLVDIAYDLSAPGFPTMAVDFGVSSDGGATWTVPAVSVSGDIGDEVAPGSGKAIVWDAGADWPGGYSALPAGGGKGSDHPAHSVNWYDVVKWCNVRSEKEGLTPVYRVGGERLPDREQRAGGVLGCERLPPADGGGMGEGGARCAYHQKRHPGGHEQLPRVPYRPQSSPLNGRQHSGGELPITNG